MSSELFGCAFFILSLFTAVHLLIVVGTAIFVVSKKIIEWLLTWGD
jgi:hypothetical protein